MGRNKIAIDFIARKKERSVSYPFSKKP
jgi:hypothetical protein